MSNQKIITIEKFKELYNSDITKRRYDILIGEIEDRVYEILDNLRAKKHIKLDWFCFENGSIEEDNCPGNFDPDTCSERIEFIGNITIKEHIEELCGYNCAIPTRWLWEEGYLKECENVLAAFNEKKEQEKMSRKNRTEERNAKRKVAIESIKQKLTKDELKFVNFK